MWASWPLPQVGSNLEGRGPMPGPWSYLLSSSRGEASNPYCLCFCCPGKHRHSNPAPWLSPLRSPLP